MYGKTSISQTCTASTSTIGISVDDLSNNIGILVIMLMCVVVAVVMVRLAIVKRQRVRDLRSAKQEAVLFNSDILSKIVSFLPSNDIQSLALTCRRLGVREENELSLILHDEALFRQPPPLYEDCPICELRLPTLESGSSYMGCCGKIMCSGCYYSSHHDNNGNAVDDLKCSFCRAPYPSDKEEAIRMLKKRVEAGDASAMNKLGCCYLYGRYGFPQDYTKALELHHRSAELGYAKAYYSIGLDYDTYGSIGYAYSFGEGVEVDKKKARHYFELAAMKGCTSARYFLGNVENRSKNTNRALNHYLIAVKDGHNKSLKQIQRLFVEGRVTKDKYTKEALQLYQKYLSEIKSDQRDQAAAANDKYRYY